MHRLPFPAAEEHCAWYASPDPARPLLWTGIAPFWSSFHASGGDPRADLAVAGPQVLGRFDLAAERWLEPIDLGAPDAPTGTWDVLARSGAVWFSTFFGGAGRLRADGVVERFSGLGSGLGELAPGPDGSTLVARYDGPRGGSVLRLDAAGRLQAEWPLAPAGDARAAAKSVAFDARRGHVWLNTDLLSEAGAGLGHDARVLDLSGRELLRFAEPELQFVSFDAAGVGWFVLVDGPRLRLRILAPPQAGEPPQPPGLLRGLIVALDDAFDARSDFVQDLAPTREGGMVVTRWSGRIHLVQANGRSRSLELPRPGGAGLYYTAVLHRGKLCATLCAGVTVVCRDLGRGSADAR